MSRVRTAAVLVLVMLGSAAVTQAQSNAEVNAGVQFDFSLPGARSLSLGGAFVAVADDATAVWANPAGLTILARPEISFEGRVWSFSNIVTDRGHGYGPPTGAGFDTVPDFVNGESSSTSVAPSFISYAMGRDNWSIGVFRHQVSKYRADLSSSGPFFDTTQPGIGGVDRMEPFRASMELDIENYGVATGIELGPSLSVGLGLSAYHLSMDSATDRYLYLPFNSFPLPRNRTAQGEAFGPPSYAPENLWLDIEEEGSDWGLGAAAGVLWRAPRWSAGAAYRYAPTFEYDAVAVIGPGGLQDPFFAQFVGAGSFDEEVVKFNQPDTLALGFSVRPSNALMVSFEYDRVWYSQLSDNIAEVFGLEERNPDPVAGRFNADLNRNGLKFPDVNQVRVGAEYALVRPGADFLLRLGGWYDPDHRMRFISPLNYKIRLDPLFRPGEDEFHVAPGFGIALDQFQLDTAVDISSRVTTFSVSAVYRF